MLAFGVFSLVNRVLGVAPRPQSRRPLSVSASFKIAVNNPQWTRRHILNKQEPGPDLAFAPGSRTARSAVTDLVLRMLVFSPHGVL